MLYPNFFFLLKNTFIKMLNLTAFHFPEFLEFKYGLIKIWETLPSSSFQQLQLYLMKIAYSFPYQGFCSNFIKYYNFEETFFCFLLSPMSY